MVRNAFIYFFFLNLLSFIIHFNNYAFAQPQTLNQKNIKLSSCPLSQKEKQQISSIQLKIDYNSFLKNLDNCEHSYLGLLLKSIAKLKSVRFDNIPDGIYNEVTQSLKNPWHYILQQNINSISLDKSSRAIASYDLNDGTLYVTKQFFEVSSTSQAATLIHEATHSNSSLPWHDICYQGQLMATVGGCDSSIESQSSIAGAYSVEYWFLRLVASQGHNFYDDHEILESYKEAKEMVSHRFNHVYQEAQFNDILVVLDNQKKIFTFDPLFKEFIPLKNLKKPIKKISINPLNHGLYLYDNNNYVFTWSPDSQEISPIENSYIKPFQGNIKSIQRPLHPTLGANRNLLTVMDGTILLEGLNNKQDREYLPYDTVKDLTLIFVLYGKKHLALDLNNKILLLDSNHKPLSIPFRNSPKKIQAVFPTHFAFAFYTINEGGEVFFSKIERQGGMPSDLSSQTLRFEKDEFQAPENAKAVKISEGVGYSALLDDQGSLTLKTYSKNKKLSAKSDQPQKEIILNSEFFISNFVFTKVTRFNNETINQSADAIIRFKDTCHVQVADIEPWLQRPIGLNQNGEVVVWQEDQCRVLIAGVNEFQLTDSGISINPFGYNQTALLFKFENGDEKKILPIHNEIIQ